MQQLRHHQITTDRYFVQRWGKQNKLKFLCALTAVCHLLFHVTANQSILTILGITRIYCLDSLVLYHHSALGSASSLLLGAPSPKWPILCQVGLLLYHTIPVRSNNCRQVNLLTCNLFHQEPNYALSKLDVANGHHSICTWIPMECRSKHALCAMH